jgi:hypothetical protein
MGSGGTALYFLTLELDGVSGQLDTSAKLTDPGAHHIGGWVGHKVGLEVMKKREVSCPFWESKLGCPTRSLAAILNELFQLQYQINF